MSLYDDLKTAAKYSQLSREARKRVAHHLDVVHETGNVAFIDFARIAAVTAQDLDDIAQEYYAKARTELSTLLTLSPTDLDLVWGELINQVEGF